MDIYKLLEAYYDKFRDVFPMMEYDLSKEEAAELIEKCISLGKKAQELKPLKKDVYY